MKGQRPKSVTIGYMAEFAAISSASRVRYNVMGVTDKGQIMWSCEATIDWSRGKIVGHRDLSPKYDHPQCS